jgi:hypothetical protein
VASLLNAVPGAAENAATARPGFINAGTSLFGPRDRFLDNPVGTERLNQPELTNPTPGIDPVVGYFPGTRMPMTATQRADMRDRAQLATATTLGMVGGIKAYHGSPHSFDRFDLGKIGTGEGAQVYGHGLYFAENEGVARSYRDALAGYDWNRTASGAPISSNLSRMLEDGYQAAASQGVRRPTASDAAFMAQRSLEAQKADALAAKDFDWFSQVQDHSAELDRINRDLPKPTGHMYEVDINADPERYLHWDKPLSEQSPYVQDALSKTEYLYHAERAGMKDPTGGDLVKNIVGDSPGGSDMLREAGIPGIKYLDQGSRGAGEGTHNYVVFNPETIDIIRKYGIAGLTGGGAAAAADQSQGAPDGQ